MKTRVSLKYFVSYCRLGSSIEWTLYSMISFQWVLIPFSNLWIHLVFKTLVTVSRSEIPKTEPGVWFAVFFYRCKGNYILFFQSPFLCSLKYLTIWLIVLIKVFGWVSFCFRNKFSLLNCHLFCHNCYYQGQNYQNAPHVFYWRIVTMWPYHLSCFISFIFICFSA